MPSRGSKQKKRATMRLVYIDFWSALKMSFLVSIIVAAITVVIGLLIWAALERFGAVAAASNFLEDIAGEQGASLVAGLTFPNVMTFTLVVALLEVIVVSALGAIFAALFNLAVHVVGGWKVTFGSD
jgi:ABC-type Fe3+ transport system permease subunit